MAVPKNHHASPPKSRRPGFPQHCRPGRSEAQSRDLARPASARPQAWSPCSMPCQRTTVRGPGQSRANGIPEALLSPCGENRPSSIACASAISGATNSKSPLKSCRPGRSEAKSRDLARPASARPKAKPLRSAPCQQPTCETPDNHALTAFRHPSTNTELPLESGHNLQT